MEVICDGKRCAKKQECTRFLAFENAVKLEPDRVTVFWPSPRMRTGDDHCVGFERT